MTSQAAEVRVRYAPATDPVAEGDAFRLRIPTDGIRAECALVAELSRPGVARDALLTMGEILTSDLRFRPRSRADYLAYLLAQGKRVTQEVWNAQRDFLRSKYGEAAQEESPLDPVLSVDERGLSIEVFSADESAYARLWMKADQAYRASELRAGTSYVRLPPALLAALGRLRSYRSSTLELSPTAAGEGDEQRFLVPLRWIRAFGQVQSASTLPLRSFELAPVDLYNVLLTLRQRRARKPPRALRYELVPGERPRLVLEPWEVVIESTGAVYEGAMPMVVRTWGRNRLSVLARLLPHARSVRIHLVGPGLPAYYVIDLGDAELTLALSGWTDAGWAGIATFDLLDAGEVDEVLARKALSLLQQGPRTLAELATETGRATTELRPALLHHIQRGIVMHDVAHGRYVHRPLLSVPPDPEALRFRDAREAEAHRLLASRTDGKDAVRLTRVHDLGSEGTKIEGEVDDPQAHRSYKTSFTLDREGRTVDASCTSPQFRRSGLREGPTVPMMALRLLYARQRAELERARNTEEGRRLIRAETRTFVRRDRTGSLTFRVSLDHRQVTVRWGPHPDRMRMQRLLFSTPEEASTEYFGRLEKLSYKGFIDASAAD
ncbi:hypothetical protein [Paraliomyxa miuraensis]|uniref:hypothetical protein n=1 Tax=Paraliomyxa miuraensis TaxID=376150 RepID=UPI002250F37A|nr:hypothetical protein [Paraliomyxa miuraensis]MCX4243902.1 hypothetical protein [Paraliomyxa miuraensis]